MSPVTNLQQLHQRYQEFCTRYPNAAADFLGAIEDVLSDAGLTYDHVTARVKEWRSLRSKSRKRRPDGTLMYPHPWQDIHDLIGVRVTTYHSTEIPRIIEALTEVFEVRRSVDKTAQTRVSGSFGYGSHHLILRVPPARVAPVLQAYAGREFEVQIRTVLQHAWAEFEHDIRYKRRGNTGKLAPEVDRAFTLAAGLIELADQQFDLIAAQQSATDTTAPIDLDVKFTAETLPGIIALLHGNTIPQSRLEHYHWLEELLHAHELTTVAQLTELMSPANLEQVKTALHYTFQPGQVRIIDDLLLAAFGEEHIAKTGTTGKFPAQRPARLRHRLALINAAQAGEGRFS
ncbi:GTP pyrophosphokinase family protein [Corynebacterium matruchotii]|uniref:GTP pyrophosphokinase n=1 Tax=Corynebacterium matruchotii TaxID=43768 RepID=UPI0028E2C619|nr:GTP pyrophosphokinase family protein [Corynebacterium matruchotii]